ncbi:MAG: hypothetical protein ACUVS7_17850, partial [Bryobacteraceae bacterium]
DHPERAGAVESDPAAAIAGPGGGFRHCSIGTAGMRSTDCTTPPKPGEEMRILCDSPAVTGVRGDKQAWSPRAISMRT